MAIITISRELGSGGVLLGEELTRRLGYSHLSRKAMIEALERHGLKIPLEKVDERMPGIVDRLFRLSKGDFLSALQAILEEAAREGNAIIQGWGSQILLRDHPDSLHVRVVASEESRRNRLMELAHMPPGAAQETLARADRDQSLFGRYFFDASFDDLKLYDLVINTDQLSIEAAGDLVLVALETLLPRR